MTLIIPDRATAEKNGWIYQVQWIEGGNPCYVRCKSGPEADHWADKLKKQGLSPSVFDLVDALRLH